MSTNNHSNKSQDAIQAAAMMVGLNKHYSNVSSLTIDGVAVTTAQVTTSLQAIVDLRKAVTDARAALQAKIALEEAQTPALHSTMAALVTFVKGSYANSPDVLADFGIAPKKARTPLTVQQKAAAAAKRASTRAARHTMGSKQRKAVKGDVTGVTVTPVTSGTAPGANGATAPTGTAGAPANGGNASATATATHGT